MPRNKKSSGVSSYSSSLSSINANLKDVFNTFDYTKPKKKVPKVYKGYTDEEKDKLSINKRKKLEQEYKEILERRNIHGVAYRVIFTKHPNLLHITFKSTNSKARWDASNYLYKSLCPDFIGNEMKDILTESRAYRIPELDKYAIKGVVPIPELMKKVDMTFSCYACGKHHFTYEDYCKNLCFIVEGESNQLPFANGFVLCYKCHEKLLK